MTSLSGKKKPGRASLSWGTWKHWRLVLAAMCLPASGVLALAQASVNATGTSTSAIGATVEPGHCGAWVRRLPNVTLALCKSAQLKPSGAVSVKNVPLYQRDIAAPSPGNAGGQQPHPRRQRVLVLGTMHGDELSSASVVFHWMAYAAAASEGRDWRFVPVVNPDGLMAPRPTRFNARGVDLNRNFPTPDWDRQALKYWAERTRSDKRRYPGQKAASEPETRFVLQAMGRWKPDLIVSVHAPYGVLDFDGPSEPPQRLGRLHLDRVGIFPGSLGHYGGVHKGTSVVTIELPEAGRTPTEAEMRQMWADLQKWIGQQQPADSRKP
jgi:protein MpaA